MISIIAIGKRHEAWIVDGVERYSKRLQGPWKLDWILLPHSSYEGLQTRQDESRRILERLSPSDAVVLLDEKGRMLDSPSLARHFEALQASGRRIICVIGGAYGVTDDVLERADFVWSLSPLVYPHQLVRLIVAEQLYRAQSITSNHPYHHE